MRASIDVKDRSEKVAIETALSDPATRAFVVIIGTLQRLPTDRARTRVLRWVADKMDESAGSLTIESGPSGNGTALMLEADVRR